MPEAWLVEAPGLPYANAWELQNRLFALRRANKVPDVLIFTEHPPVYTFGKSGKREHLLYSEQEVAARKIELYWADRGGDITFHGPGQLVGYPIFDLHSYDLDVGWFLRALESCLIQALEIFDIHAGRVSGYTGVWVDDEKIASIGIKLSRWVSMHGFALNVNTDLRYFLGIVPCGISDKKMTSLAKLAGHPINMCEVVAAVRAAFVREFDLDFQDIPLSRIAPEFDVLENWNN